MTSSDPAGQNPRARRSRLLLLLALVAVLLASVAADVLLVAQRGFAPFGIDGGPAEAQRERDAVMSQARQFMLRMGTYGPDQLEGGQLPEYRELVSEVITPKLRASFDRQVTAAEGIVAQAGVAREAEVFSTGVSTLGEDSATTLVAGTFTDAYPARGGDLEEQQPVPFRIEVTLVRSDGEWLIDDFEPVTGEERE